MKKGTTSTGFDYEFDETLFEDMEFIELLAEADGNGMLFPKFLDKMLGKEQKKKLYDHVRGDNSRVSIIDVKKEVIEMMEVTEETKN
jgi:hypothetical protein